MSFEADQTVEMQKDRNGVCLSVAPLISSWHSSHRGGAARSLRIAAELLAAAQFTVSSICFHSLGQDSLLCSSDTFSRRAAQCNYTMWRGWFSELQLALLSSVYLNIFLLWAAVVFVLRSLSLSKFICVRARQKEESGIAYRHRVFFLNVALWTKKASPDWPTSVLFTRFRRIISQVNSAHSLFFLLILKADHWDVTFI